METLGKSVVNPEFNLLDLEARKKHNELLDLEIEARKIEVERLKVVLLQNLLLEQQRKSNKLLDLDIELKKVAIERQKVVLEIEKKGI